MFTYERLRRLQGRQSSQLRDNSNLTQGSPGSSSSFIVRNVAGSRLGNRQRSLSNGYFNPDWERRFLRSEPVASSQPHVEQTSSQSPSFADTNTLARRIPQPASSHISFNQFLTQHNLDTTLQSRVAQFNATISMAIELLMQNSIAIRRSQLDHRVHQAQPILRTEPAPTTTPTPAQDFTAFVNLVQNNHRNSEIVEPLLDQTASHSSTEGILHVFSI